MPRNRKYVLDLSDLQYKQVRLPWKMKILRLLFWVSLSIVVSLFYGFVFRSVFGSPKEKLLTRQMENLKLQYSLIGRQLDNSAAALKGFRLSDDRRYRPILDMDSIPESYRKAGYGGVDRFRDLTGYMNSDLLISYRTKLEDMRNQANIQKESYKSIAEMTIEWKREVDHQPLISPVDVKYRLGDGFKFREVHPVFGTPRMHYGQDFAVPYGTEVYATGDGTVIESGWNSGGFGNFIVIDHGYGLQSTYGHLSQIKVSKGMNIKRGDMVGLSGNTGTSSGPHLHYQIDQFGEHKNPVNFFNNDISVDEYNEMIQALGSKSKFR
ncbi:MAG: M23 family metallopeptidase [Bacteroidales bacterium]|nr:M23 family metallopeptidase [Bacteroidales bacterium]MBK8882808.1 M23 family metallopeptidase [Bacteroidales bacterium]